MKKATLHKVTAIGMIAALTASQSAVVFAEEGDSSDKITLTFAFDEGVGTPTEEAIKAFNESQDEIEVQSYHLPQDANNLHDDFVNKMVAGDTSVDSGHNCNTLKPSGRSIRCICIIQTSF